MLKSAFIMSLVTKKKKTFFFANEYQVCFQCIFESPLCVFDTDETSHTAVIGRSVFV